MLYTDIMYLQNKIIFSIYYMFFTVFNAYTPHFQTKLRRIDLSHSNHNCVVVSSTGIRTLTKKDFGFGT